MKDEWQPSEAKVTDAIILTVTSMADPRQSNPSLSHRMIAEAIPDHGFGPGCRGGVSSMLLWEPIYGRLSFLGTGSEGRGTPLSHCILRSSTSLFALSLPKHTRGKQASTNDSSYSHSVHSGLQHCFAVWGGYMCEGKDGHSRFSPVSSINILTKSALGKKGSFAHSSKLQFIMMRKSNQELKSQNSTQE